MDKYTEFLLNYFNIKKNLRVIRFNMHDIYIKNSSGDIHGNIESARKQMSRWLSTQIRNGSVRIGDFEVELYALGNPNKYQGVRVE